MNGEVIILTGPPGAGKTTVAQLLSTTASVPTVHLMTDLFYRSIRAGFVPPFLPEARRQNDVVIEAIVGTSKPSPAFMPRSPSSAISRTTIDTGNLDAEQTAAEVRRLLVSARYRLA